MLSSLSIGFSNTKKINIKLILKDEQTNSTVQQPSCIYLGSDAGYVVMLVRPGYHRIIERVLPFPGVLYTSSSFALNKDMPMPKIKCNLRITRTYA